MSDCDRGGFFFGNDWIWIVIIVVVILLIFPGIFNNTSCTSRD